MFEPAARRRRAGVVPQRARGVHPRARGPLLHRAGRARRLHRLRALRRGLPRQGPHPAQAQGHQHGSRSPSTATASARRSTSSARSPTSPRTRIPAPVRAPWRCCPPLFEFSGACAGCGETPYIRAAHPALRRPPRDRQRHGLLVDLRRQPPHHPVHDRRRRSGAGVEQLAVRGQRRVRPRAAPRARRRRATAPASSSDACAPDAPRRARRRARRSPCDGDDAALDRRRRAGRRAARPPRRPSTAADAADAGRAGRLVDAPFGVGRRRRRLGLRHRLRRPRPRARLEPQRQRAGARHRGVLQHRRPAVEGHADRRGRQVRVGRQGDPQEGPRPARHELRPRLRRQRRDAGPQPPHAQGPRWRPRATRGRRWSSPTAPASRTATTWSTPPPSRPGPSTAAPGRCTATTPAGSRDGEPPAGHRRRPDLGADARATWSRRPGSGWSSCATPTGSTTLVHAAEDAVRDRHALYEQLAQIRYPDRARPDQEPTMADLTTTWLGLELRARSSSAPRRSPTTSSGLRGLVAAGAGAVVLRSVFEEQIVAEQLAVHRFIDSHVDNDAEARSFLPDSGTFPVGAEPAVRAPRSGCAPRSTCRSSRRSTGSPPAAGPTSPASCEDAGADAIELNLYDLATDLDETGADIEDRQLRGGRVGRRHRRHPGHGEAVALLLARSRTSSAASKQPAPRAWPCSTASTNPTSTPTPSTSTATSTSPPRPSCPLRLHALALLHGRVGAVARRHRRRPQRTRRGQGHPVRRQRPSRWCPPLLEGGPGTSGPHAPRPRRVARRDGLPRRRRGLRRDGARQRREPPAWERVNYTRLLQGWRPRRTE